MVSYQRRCHCRLEVVDCFHNVVARHHPGVEHEDVDLTATLGQLRSRRLNGGQVIVVENKSLEHVFSVPRARAEVDVGSIRFVGLSSR